MTTARRKPAGNRARRAGSRSGDGVDAGPGDGLDAAPGDGPDAGARMRIRLGTPAEIVDAVPYLVGFEPADSLVLVSLRGPRGRVGLTMRVDLPPIEQAGECARQLVPHLKRNGAWRAVIVFYPAPDSPGRSAGRGAGRDDPVVRALYDALATELAAARIEIADALCVHDGRWSSLHCFDPACCPPEGTPVERGATSPLAAAMTVVEGRQVLASRADLERSLDPVDGIVGAAMAYALRKVDSEIGARSWAGHREQIEKESLAAFGDAVERRLAGGVPLAVDETARLIVGLDDLPVRDEVLSWVEGDRGVANRGVLEHLVAHAVPPFHVVPLTTLGWVAYLQGDGALASMAAERALAADPGYSLALMLDEVTRCGIDPAVFRAVVATPGM